ncbi:MAG: hypothetical protein Q7R64_02355 [bacterium]|nr:hypothetical protein [bacterium]
MKKICFLALLSACLQLEAGETNLVIIPISRSPRPGEALQATFIAPPGKRIIAIGYVWTTITNEPNFGSGPNGLALLELRKPTQMRDESFKLTPKLELRLNSPRGVATFPEKVQGFTVAIQKSF